MALTRKQMDAALCDTPGCSCGGDILYLHPRCHPGGGLTGSYKEGVVTLTCRVCEKLVVEVAVAPHDYTEEEVH